MGNYARTDTLAEFNYSASQTPDPVLGYTGYLMYTLEPTVLDLTSPMNFQYSASSNVALPLFTPSQTGLPLGFDSNGLMYINQGLNDTAVPPQYVSNALYQWYICYTEYSYSYWTLAWIVGVDAVPQNPTCVSVDVKRVFI